jgi:acyl carrier protein
MVLQNVYWNAKMEIAMTSDFESFLKLIANSQSLKIEELTPETTLVSDLGIAGDDFYDVISLLSKTYGTDFSEFPIEETAGLEGSFNPFAYVWRKIMGNTKKTRDATLLELFDAIQAGKWCKRDKTR